MTRERLGRYELLRELGRGGTGTVWEAELVGPGGFRKLVAVKVLRGGEEVLRREARLGGLLRHRHLVDVYEVGEQDGRWFCALELCTGGRLTDRLPLPPRAVVEVGLQVCEALAYAHRELGLVHLDLKPDNLLLHDGDVKVADLGIARAEGFAGDDRIRGTPGYMAPEQARGGAVDARSDVYALGVTLVELATGARPSSSATLSWDDVADDPSVTVDADAPVSAEAPDGGIPAWLEPAIGRCLAADPADRWPDVEALAEALGQLDAPGKGLRAALGIDEATGGADARPGTNLRPEADAFVGRTGQLERLATILAAPALVVLWGPAGIGKSRLAEEAARRWRDGTGRPAWRVDLSEARDPGGLAVATGTTLVLPLGKGGVDEQLARIEAGLRALGPALVVLDGFEQLASCAPIVGRWREIAPEARILVTSRAALPLNAEVVAVGPLPAEEAVPLLVARAQERGAEIGGDPALAALAARLDGVPLAIELAAGRLGVLSVSDVLDRFGLSMLRRGTAGRHGTLTAALDWSWELLSPAEREALAQLSVFAGGFTLEAAEGVLDLGGASVFDAISALVERSMVSPAGGSRFTLLAGVREYAAERLGAEPGPEVRHGRWFARFGAEDWIAGLDRTGGPERRRLAADLENVTAACRRAVARAKASEEHGPMAVALLAASWVIFESHGPYSAAVELARQVAGLDLGGSAGRQATWLLARALHHDGRAAEAYPLYLSHLQSAREAGDRRAEALNLGAMATYAYERGRMDEASSLYQAALTLHRALGARRAEGVTLGNLAAIHVVQGRRDDARACYEAAMRIHRAMGNRRSEGAVLGNLGILARRAGRPAEARERYEEALRIQRELGDRRGEASVLGNLGGLHRQEGRRDEARACFEAALRVNKEIGNRHLEAVARVNLAELLLEEQRHDEAAPLLDAALVALRELGQARWVGIAVGDLGLVHHARGRLADAATSLEEAIGALRGVSDPYGVVVQLVRLAAVEADRGAPDAAAAHLDEAEPLAGVLADTFPRAAICALRAEVASMRGDADAALAALAQAEAHPLDADAARAVARARSRMAHGR